MYRSPHKETADICHLQPHIRYRDRYRTHYLSSFQYNHVAFHMHHQSSMQHNSQTHTNVLAISDEELKKTHASFRPNEDYCGQILLSYLPVSAWWIRTSLCWCHYSWFWRCVIIKKEDLKQHPWTSDIYCSFSSVTFVSHCGCITMILDKCSQVIIYHSFCFMSKDIMTSVQFDYHLMMKILVQIIQNTLKQHPSSTDIAIFFFYVLFTTIFVLNYICFFRHRPWLHHIVRCD